MTEAAEIEVFEAWFGDLFDELFSDPPLTPGDRHDRAGSCCPLLAGFDRPAGRQRSLQPPTKGYCTSRGWEIVLLRLCHSLHPCHGGTKLPIWDGLRMA